MKQEQRKNNEELHIYDDDHLFEHMYPHWVWPNETQLNHSSVLQLGVENIKMALEIKPLRAFAS